MTQKPTSSTFEPHDCPQCRRLATDPNPPRLIEGYIIEYDADFQGWKEVTVVGR